MHSRLLSKAKSYLFEIGFLFFIARGDILFKKMKIDNNLTMQDMLAQIKYCEGKHIQQVVFSTYHKALTQVCFGCGKVRTMLSEEDTKEKEE